jgi:hypothetical protein
MIRKIIYTLIRNFLFIEINVYCKPGNFRSMSFSQFAVVICIRAVLISRFVKLEKNKMLIVFQTVKQLLFTTIGFQRRSHLHINVNEVSSNHLFTYKR